MSEIESDLDRAAASYWLSVANKAGPGKSAALQQAANLLRDARAEAGIPDSAKPPILNTIEAPPLDVLKPRRLTRYSAKRIGHALVILALLTRRLSLRYP